MLRNLIRQFTGGAAASRRGTGRRGMSAGHRRGGTGATSGGTGAQVGRMVERFIRRR